MFCSNCGKKLKEDERFCKECGMENKGFREENLLRLSRSLC